MLITYADVIARYRSCPAVSHIWAFIILPSTWMLLVANSTPIVLLLSKLNSLRVNRERRLLLPTPESPISTTKDKTRVIRIAHHLQIYWAIFIISFIHRNIYFSQWDVGKRRQPSQGSCLNLTAQIFSTLPNKWRHQNHHHLKRLFLPLFNSNLNLPE